MLFSSSMVAVILWVVNSKNRCIFFLLFLFPWQIIKPPWPLKSSSQDPALIFSCQKLSIFQCGIYYQLHNRSLCWFKPSDQLSPWIDDEDKWIMHVIVVISVEKLCNVEQVWKIGCRAKIREKGGREKERDREIETILNNSLVIIKS